MSTLPGGALGSCNVSHRDFRLRAEMHLPADGAGGAGRRPRHVSLIYLENLILNLEKTRMCQKQVSSAGGTAAGYRVRTRPLVHQSTASHSSTALHETA